VLAAWAGEDGLPPGARFGPRTLGEVRRRGWAYSVAQREAGVASVSAPVRDHAGEIVAAISVSGPVERMGRRPGPRLAPLVTAGASALSARL
jgi:DNA-binding IclR family transcriptional regulator